MASAQKKVILRRLDGTVQAGYLPGSRLLQRETRTLDLLDAAGRMVATELSQVRYVAFVRDFNLNDLENPERLFRKTFLARPRSEGLWVRLTFSDGDVMEGLTAIDKSLLEDAAEDEGLFLLPPDTRSNTQRIYVPRQAIRELQLLAVVTTPSRVAKPRPDRGLDLPFSGSGSEL